MIENRNPSRPPAIDLPPQVDRDAVLASLERVLDPELDESVLALGFVESVTGDALGNITVDLRLPTYWCAANFSYLMASDARRALVGLPGVRSVRVRLSEHFASREVEDGAGPGKSFAEAFPNSGPDTLEETRQIFLRKGFFTRQEKLLRALRRAGLSFDEIAELQVRQLLDDCNQDVGAETLSRYLQRREELGLDCSEASPLIVDLHGAPVPPGEMETYYVRARTTRLAMEANGSLCSAMLEARNSNWKPGTP